MPFSKYSSRHRATYQWIIWIFTWLRHQDVFLAPISFETLSALLLGCVALYSASNMFSTSRFQDPQSHGYDRGRLDGVGGRFSCEEVLDLQGHRYDDIINNGVQANGIDDVIRCKPEITKLANCQVGH